MRHSGRRILINDTDEYSNMLEERSTKHIEYYGTKTIVYPTEKEINQIAYREYIWGVGDRIYKIAEKYAGGAENWWMILTFNKIGCETLIKVGDMIKIPIDLELFVSFMVKDRG
jgi:hypothetical protein